MLHELGNVLFNVACLTLPIVVLFLWTLARYTVEHLRERRAHRRYCLTILNAIELHSRGEL